MSEQPQTPPSWLGAIDSDAGKIQLPFNDVAIQFSETDAWHGTQRLKATMKKIGNDSLRVIYPSTSISETVEFLKRYSVPMQWQEGHETMFRDQEEDWIPANGVMKFSFQGVAMYAIVMIDYSRPHASTWFLAAPSVEAGAALLQAVGNSKKEGPHRECWMIGNRSQRSDSLLKEVDRLTWEDLVMDAKPKADLRACCESVFSERTAAVYERMGLPRKKGLIIHGPPGNGKTMTGKVAAGVTGASLVYVTTSRQPGFLRERTPAEIFEEVYARAQKLAPCVVMLEEIDGLIDKNSRPVLLTILDGLVPNEGVLTIATTNYVDRLDPALVNRPSRFDRVFEFGYPTLQPRRQYMERRMRQAMGIPFDAPLDRPLVSALNRASKLTDGLSFSHLQEIIVGAASHVTEVSSSTPGKALTLSTERILDCFKREQIENAKPKRRRKRAEEDEESTSQTNITQDVLDVAGKIAEQMVAGNALQNITL